MTEKKQEAEPWGIRERIREWYWFDVFIITVVLTFPGLMLVLVFPSLLVVYVLYVICIFCVVAMLGD